MTPPNPYQNECTGGSELYLNGDNQLPDTAVLIDQVQVEFYVSNDINVHFHIECRLSSIAKTQNDCRYILKSSSLSIKLTHENVTCFFFFP